jgi:glucokinase
VNGIGWNDEDLRLVLDLGGTSVRAGFVRGSGVIERGGRKNERIAKNITTREALRDLIAEHITAGDMRQKAYALSVAGPVSIDNRVIRKYTNVLKDDLDIPISLMVEQEVRRRTGIEITFFVIKDAVAATMAEMGAGGAAADRNEVIALILGTGTGGAPGRRGSDGLIDFPDALSDLGHHQVDPQNTEPCNCGSRGCVELSTSGTGVVRIFNRRSRATDAYAKSALFLAKGKEPGSICAEDIAWAAAHGDQFTLAVLRESARVLALLLKNVFTSHPAMTVVLVGGFALGVGVPLLAAVRQALIEIGLPFIPRSELARYVESRLLLGRIPGDDTNLIGARLFLSQAERRG